MKFISYLVFEIFHNIDENGTPYKCSVSQAVQYYLVFIMMITGLLLFN